MSILTDSPNGHKPVTCQHTHLSFAFMIKGEGETTVIAYNTPDGHQHVFPMNKAATREMINQLSRQLIAI